MASKKRNIVLAALVLALGAAVYLNWQFSSENGLFATDTVSSSKELGEAQFVNNVPEGENGENNEEKKEEAKPSEFFTKAKATRQKARDEATEMIKEILEDAKSTEETKAEAIKQAAAIAKNIEQEANIESLVRSKGFTEALAFIQNGECSIVVGPEPLNESLAISIKDIITGQSGIPADKVKISEAK